MDLPTPSSKVIKVIEHNFKIMKSEHGQVFTKDDIISPRPLVRGEDGDYVSGDVVTEDEDDEQATKAHRSEKYKKLTKDITTHLERRKENAFRKFSEKEFAKNHDK